MRKKQIAIISLGFWFMIISIAMLLTGRFDLALFFVLGFIGFLIIVELAEPRYVKPGYVGYIRILIVVGILIFVMVVIQKVLEILGLEIVL
jgi:hypothetical protein